MNKKELWESVLAEIQSNISQANFNTWFKNTEIKSLKGPEVEIVVPHSFAKDWLEKKYSKTILQALNSSGEKIKKIKYTIVPQAKIFKKPLPSFVNENQLEFIELQSDKETNLNPRYTFESFVVGPFNELPHAAAWAVATNPGSMYNPLFIYGGVGLGKTHLMQAVGNEVLQKFPKKKIKYVSTEKFTSEVVSSIRNKSMESFKKKYREIDVLIIDDAQFLSGKEKTQEEFFHTFNELYGKNKQIIISSDRPPRAIQSLAERLKSRFEGGMIADISHPDFETRLAILKTKAQEKNEDFSEEIYSYIAENVQKNIRELEGALNKLIAHQKLKGKIMEAEKAKLILKESFNLSSRRITPQQVIKVISQFYNLKEKDIISSSRKREIVKPRQVAMYVLRKDLNYSFPFIGKKLGGKDHTTVIHSCEKISREAKADESFKEEIELIRHTIQTS